MLQAHDTCHIREYLIYLSGVTGRATSLHVVARSPASVPQ
jgi:hypothetical protein